MTDQQRFQDKQWGQIVAKAWGDEEFKHRLIADPASVLRDHGLEISPGVQVCVHEDSETVRHLVLPPNPAGDLLEEELAPTAGADSYSGFCGDCHRCERCGRCGCGCDRY